MSAVRVSPNSYEDYEPGIFSKDCIAMVRSLVNAVSHIQVIFQLLVFVVEKTYRSVTAILKNSDFRNMLKNILSKTISYFAMYPQGGLQHY